MKLRLVLMILSLALVAGLSACQKEEGPMEKAGKAMDEAAHDAERAVEDAADDVKDAVEDAGD